MLTMVLIDFKNSSTTCKILVLIASHQYWSSIETPQVSICCLPVYHLYVYGHKLLHFADAMFTFVKRLRQITAK